MSYSAREMLEAMPDAFLPEKAGDATARIQLDLTGDDGGAWLLDIAGGQCNVSEEKASQADVTVTMDADDFVALYSNKLNPCRRS
jgi:putative sterol carrier protein